MGREEATETLYPSVTVSYTVNEQDMYQFLKHMILFQLEAIQSFLIVALPAFFSLGCLVIGLLTHRQNSFLFAAAMLAVSAILFFKVLQRCHRQAKKASTGWNSPITLKIYSDRIIMYGNSSQKEIPLDGTILCKCIHRMIVFFFPAPKQGKADVRGFLILPLRCIQQSELSNVKTMIFAGTRSR